MRISYVREIVPGIDVAQMGDMARSNIGILHAVQPIQTRRPLKDEPRPATDFEVEQQGILAACCEAFNYKCPLDRQGKACEGILSKLWTHELLGNITKEESLEFLRWVLPNADD